MDFIQKREELDNRSVNVNYNKKKYYGTFSINDKYLVLSVFYNDFDVWKEYTKDFDCLTASMVDTETELSLINCNYKEAYSQPGPNGVRQFVTCYSIDRVLVGYAISNIRDLFISCITASYKDTSWLTDSSIYNRDFFHDKVVINTLYKEFNLKDKTVTFSLLPAYESNDDKITVSGNREFTVFFKKKKNFYEAIQYIYLIKNLLMIMGKIKIEVCNMSIHDSDNCFNIIDGFVDLDAFKNIDEFYSSIMNKICFKIDDFSDFSNVLENFEKEYKKLFPVIELYWNVLRNRIPNLTRFISDITMLEYYSREYDKEKPLKRTKKRNPKKSEPQFVDMVYSLIENANSIFNFTADDILKISKIIKDARTYYIHYVRNGVELRPDKLFRICYFIEDVVIINIYRQIGIDFDKYSELSFYNFIYNLEELIN